MTVRQVAVKSLHVYVSDKDGEAMKNKSKVSTLMKILCMDQPCHLQRILHELVICARMKHRNILPVQGYTSGFGPFMAIVSPWVENGNLEAYLKRKDTSLPLVRRFQIVSLCLSDN